MDDRIVPWTGSKLFGATETSTPVVDAPAWNNPIDAAKLDISSRNSTFWADPVMDNALASRYIDPNDQVNATYVDKIGMELWYYADIQNLDTKIIDSYQLLNMPDNDIFWDPNLSPEEKVALSTSRKSKAFNEINNLRKLQSAKKSELSSLAEAEQKKADAIAAEKKASLQYLQELNETQKLGLDIEKHNFEISKYNNNLELQQDENSLAKEKFLLDRDKFISLYELHEWILHEIYEIQSRHFHEEL